MASPVVEDKNNNPVDASTAATSHAVPLPATVSPGALLLIVGRAGAGGAAVSVPAGWTVSYDFSDSTDDTAFWGYKTTAAVGNEGGTTVTVTHSSAKCGVASFSITGAADPATRPPEASAYSNGSSTAPDSLVVTPTGGTKDYLFLSCGTWGNGSPTASAYAAGYTYVFGAFASGGSSATQCAAVVAGKAATGSSDDPSAWTLPSALPWIAWTVAVHPAAAVTVTKKTRVISSRVAAFRAALR